MPIVFGRQGKRKPGASDTCIAVNTCVVFRSKSNTGKKGSGAYGTLWRNCETASYRAGRKAYRGAEKGNAKIWTDKRIRSSVNLMRYRGEYFLFMCMNSPCQNCYFISGRGVFVTYIHLLRVQRKAVYGFLNWIPGL